MTIDAMKSKIDEKLGLEAPSWFSYTDDDIIALYNELFNNADSSDKEDEFIYDDIINNIFGKGKLIKVFTSKGHSVEIVRKSLIDLYKPLKLSGSVFEKVLWAHNEVLETGLNTGNEHIIIIDARTGLVKGNEIGTSYEVNFYLDPQYSGDLITVHNHPSSLTFSPLDIYTFNKFRQINCSSIQGHNGSLYALHKSDSGRYNMPLEALQGNFKDLLNIAELINEYPKITCEKFINGVLNYTNWIYLKGE